MLSVINNKVVITIGNIIAKLFKWTILSYLSLISIAILLVSVLFFSLDTYKDRIAQIVYHHSGYRLKIAKITTSLNKQYLPQFIIDGITLTNPSNQTQNIKIGRFYLILSYSSLWHLQPIFAKIALSDSNLNLTLSKSGGLLLNGINLIRPDKKIVANAHGIKIDLETWLLRQQQITLENVSVLFSDQHYGFGSYGINNITATLNNSLYSNLHAFHLSLNTRNNPTQSLVTDLNWRGGKITELNHWQFATLEQKFIERRIENDNNQANLKVITKSKVKNQIGTTRSNNSTSAINNQSPLTNNATTNLYAKMANGKLQILSANFAIEHLQNFLKQNQQLFNLPLLNGKINILLHDNSYYSIDVSNFSIATQQGYLLRNKQITGVYRINKDGNLTIIDTNLQNFNGLLNLFTGTDKVKLSGVIQSIDLKWFGNIFKPNEYTLNVNFNNLGIDSHNENIPSLNHLSGSIKAHRNTIEAKLQLSNSTLIYPKVFLIPYYFKSLNTMLSFAYIAPQRQPNVEQSIQSSAQGHNNKSSHTPFKIVIAPSTLVLRDFSGSISGEYLSASVNNANDSYNNNALGGKNAHASAKASGGGYLKLHANLNKIAANKVGDYLPIQIGKEVHQWLHRGLIGGYGKNGVLDLRGNLHKFPYLNDKEGIFYIDADLDNVRLNYANGWQPLTNINGVFKIRNHQIIISANNAKVNNNTIHNALVTIPDMTSHAAYLIAQGKSYGSTNNFLGYLRQTPLDKMIGNLASNLTATGDGQVNLQRLFVPFTHPNNSEVQGVYRFINNGLHFSFAAVAPLKQVNGELLFRQNGLNINNLKANTLNSHITIHANSSNNNFKTKNTQQANKQTHKTTPAANNINFVITSNDLDYHALSKYYLPIIAPIIYGSTPTVIKFTINHHHGLSQLDVANNLVGVGVNAPDILYKSPGDTTAFKFNIATARNDYDKHAISFSYGAQGLLNGTFILNSHGGLQQGKLHLNNTINPVSFNQPKIFAISYLPQLHLLHWLNMVESLVAQYKQHEQTTAAPTTTIAKSIPLITRQTDQANHLKQTTGQSSTASLPIELLITSDNLQFGSNMQGKSYLDILIGNQATWFNMSSAFSSGYGIYNYQDNQVKLHFYGLKFYVNEDKLKLNHNNKNSIDLPNSSPDGQNINESACYLRADQVIANYGNSKFAIKLPAMSITSDELYIQNYVIGKLTMKIAGRGNNLYIESAVINGDNVHGNFNATNYCMLCGNLSSFVNINANLQIKDLGQLLKKIDMGEVMSKGNANVHLGVQWNGSFEDYSTKKMRADIHLVVEDGRLLQASRNNFINDILGIFSLQTIVNLAKFDFSSLFGDGFYFSKLKTHSILDGNILQIKYFNMEGPTAQITSYGTINLSDSTVDMYLVITPHLSGDIAIGVALATANPLIGAAAYIAEKLFRDPFNKLLSFSYYITGDMNKPTRKHVGFTKQIIDNINSAISSDIF